MHGAILAELHKYVDAKFGEATWTDLLQRAGRAGKEYDPLGDYPDEDATALVSTASAMTGAPVTKLLGDFGEFIAPELLKMFWGAIEPEWKTLDVLLHAEDTIHRIVRLNSPHARPPKLRCERPQEKVVQIRYDSPRKMCSLATGLIRGIARHYGESVDVEEPACMHRGADACLIRVTRKP